MQNRIATKVVLSISLGDEQLQIGAASTQVNLDLSILQGRTLEEVMRALAALSRHVERSGKRGRRTASARLVPIECDVQPYEVRARNVVGRSRICDLALSSAKISRRHFQLEAAGRGHVIQDLGSANHTWVNGERVDEPRELADGDVISIGDISFRYEIASP